MTEDTEPKKIVKLLCMGNKWEFGDSGERKRAEEKIIQQRSRRLTLRWWE